MSQKKISTGLTGLDDILNHLRIGDNVVWLVDHSHDYENFAIPFAHHAVMEKRRLVYMRFANHDPLLNDDQAIVYHLDAFQGFESFAARIHHIISDEGKEVFYVFDCLSDLLNAWATDSVIGDFFQVTCPFLFEMDTVAYFSLIRNTVSFQTLARIRATTQLLLALYNDQKNIVYIQPIKVWQRFSPTMFLPHIQKEDSFEPIVSSYETTQLLTNLSLLSADSQRHLDYWDRLFLFAQNFRSLPKSDEELQIMIRKLCKVMIGREKRILELAIKHFSMEDLLKIKSRMIGTGYIGGKAVGMLLARQILINDRKRHWEKHLENHDSFFVGSDVYYSYIVYNGWWTLFMEQKTDEGYFSKALQLKSKMLKGRFPRQIQEKFQRMLEYFGQSPIIVRSSSLLEDGFGNAFAGKYDSVFCVNQGTPTERYKKFEFAVKSIFASTMSEDALVYRKQRGLAHKEEPMSLLIQRISGKFRDSYFFPDLAGVGVSYNTYVWAKGMRQEAGMLRLVLGLGTRAVDRVRDDYPRIIALDAPLQKAHKGLQDTKKFSQKDIDLLHVAHNSFESISIEDLATKDISIDWDRYAARDRDAEKWYKQRGLPQKKSWILTFDPLLEKTEFSSMMQTILKTLENAYQYPVDMEFTVNFTDQNEPLINIVQCRPLQTKLKTSSIGPIPTDVEKNKILVKKKGQFMGGSVAEEIKMIVYVSADKYSQLKTAEQHEIGRIIGKINKKFLDRQKLPALLLGPGRWGTSDPAMGVPVSFSEINNIAAIGEIAFSYGDLMPELSFGSHFFQDLVESDIFYMAIFPENLKDYFHEKWILNQSNNLLDFVPDAKNMVHVLHVVLLSPEIKLWLRSDLVTQQLLCHLE